jgi:3-hydroxyacyl-CoA dehydrogenase/enoyl-CoA hydratase/3-hydroxybutyryl-CoA epimerase
LAEVEAVTRADAIFASNTSTIPIKQIAAEAARPDRVLGMHFFSPVEKMPLLEVIPTDITAPEAIVTAVRFGRRMGKTVIVVADRPGFWVNRILSPYLNEAGLMVAEGVPIEAIDKAATAWGFPVGPIALLDEIGLDVAHKAAETMRGAFGERMKGGNTLDRMLAAGRLGRKNGRGFYRYRKGRKAGPDNAVHEVLGIRPSEGAAQELIERRLVYAMLNEAAMACAESVVRSARDGDIGAIYGIGFPAFRGGPLRLIDDLGASRVVSTLHELEDQYGERFRPASALVEMARQNSRYYAA